MFLYIQCCYGFIFPSEENLTNKNTDSPAISFYALFPNQIFMSGVS